MTRPEETEQGRGLLRAICEAPWRDAPRLSFADWLEGQGQPGRAEFIRQSIARGTNPPRRFEPEDHDALEWTWPLAERCGPHGPGRWGCPPSRVGWDVEFERGLVCRAAMSRRMFLRHAGELFALHPITTVDLGTGSYLSADCAMKLRHLYDAGRTQEGGRLERVPPAIFRHLGGVGLPVSLRGAVAALPDALKGPAADHWAGRIVSRAAVAFGREAAGLTPLTPLNWEVLDR
jgi:uncharacterized protein (TIGR02996 family)